MSLDKIKEWALKYFGGSHSSSQDIVSEDKEAEPPENWRLYLFLKTDKIEKITAFFDGMSEEDRKKYLPTVRRWNRESNRDVDRAGVCGLLATGSFSHIKALRLRNPTCVNPDCFTGVLQSRKPPWTTDFVQWLLERIDHFVAAEAWLWYRDLYHRELCDRILHVSAIRLFFNTLEYDWYDGYRKQEKFSPTEHLQNDPELLALEIWKIFEEPVVPENMPATKQGTARSGFFRAFRELTESGRLSRDQVLASCLKALQLGFHERRESWYLLLFEHLQPTPEELKEHQGQLLNILENRNTVTASKVLDYLKVLEKNGSIEPSDLLNRLSPLLLDRSKGRIKKLLNFINQLARKHKTDLDLVRQIVHFGFEALSHDDAEIQASAMQLVLQYGDMNSFDVSKRLMTISDGLAPSVRAMLPKDVKSEIRIEALSSVESMSTTTASPLDERYRVIPISSVAELIETANEYMYQTTKADQLERILNGISRFGLERPEHFSKMVSSLKNIAEQWLHRDAFFRGEMGNCFVALIFTWIDDTSKAELLIRKMIGDIATESVAFDTKTILPVFRRRIAAQIRRLKRQISCPLLDAPTHLGGFIDPIVFVDRLSDLKMDLSTYSDTENQLALLRLAKDNREEALERLNRSNLAEDRSEYLEAVRYVLGEADGNVGENTPLWETAAFARDPTQNHDKILTVHRGLGCFEMLDQAYLFGISPTSTRGPVDLLNRLFPIGTKRDMMNFPTVLLHTNPYDTGVSGGMCAHWQRTVSPGRLEPYFYVGLDLLIRWEGMDEMLIPFLEPMLESHVKLSELGTAFVLVALAGQPTLRQLATDILISAIDADRLGEETFGIALRALFNREFVTQSFKRGLNEKGVEVHGRTLTLSRWAKEFPIIAHCSSRHGEMIRRGLEKMLNGEPHHNVGPLLNLLYELNVSANKKIRLNEARSYLESFSGSGKTAKLAKKLLEL